MHGPTIQAVPPPADACRGCNGDGVLWTECCNGRGGCPCRGTWVNLGTCRVCSGTGQHRADQDPDANINTIRGLAGLTGGFVGPFGGTAESMRSER